MVDVEALLSKDAFKGMEEEHKNLLRGLIVELDGKKGMEALPILLEYTKKTNSGSGKTYTKDEQNLMLNAFFDSLPDEEKGSYNALIKMMNVMNR